MMTKEGRWQSDKAMIDGHLWESWDSSGVGERGREGERERGELHVALPPWQRTSPVDGRRWSRTKL